jgi:hypothetical protein
VRGGVEEARYCLTELIEAGLLHGEVPRAFEHDGAGGRGYSVGEPPAERGRGPGVLCRVDKQDGAGVELLGFDGGRCGKPVEQERQRRLSPSALLVAGAGPGGPVSLIWLLCRVLHKGHYATRGIMRSHLVPERVVAGHHGCRALNRSA